MKKLLTFLLLTCSLIFPCAGFLTGCGQPEQFTVTVPFQEPESLVRLVVVPQNSAEMTFEYEDRATIKKIAAYISGLGTLPISKSGPPAYEEDDADAPIHYKITIRTLYENTQTYYHFGCYFKQEDGVWCKMTEEQAAGFEAILQEYRPDELAENQLFWDIPVTAPANVTSVIVEVNHNEDMTFQYTDEEKVGAIVTNIADLGIVQKTSGQERTTEFCYQPLKPNDRPFYKVTLCTADSDSEVYYFVRGLYFKQGEDGLWCWLGYNPYRSFEKLLQKYEPDIPARQLLFWNVEITVPENVTEATVVSSSCAEHKALTYTDPDRIGAIVSYLSAFGTLSNTSIPEPGGEAGGVHYTITLCTAEGDTEVYYLYGNQRIKQGENGIWCDMEYKQATALEALLKGLSKTNQKQKAYPQF